MVIYDLDEKVHSQKMTKNVESIFGAAGYQLNPWCNNRSLQRWELARLQTKRHFLKRRKATTYKQIVQSPDLVKMGEDWCSRGHEFESQHQKLFFRFTFLLNFFLTRKYGLLCISVILFSTIYLPNFSFATPKALLPLTRALPFCLFVRSSVLFFSVYFSFSQSPSNIPHSSDRSGRFD